MRAEFLDLYENHFQRVVRFVMNCGASLPDAQDAAQEAFMEAWRQMNGNDGWEKINEPEGWIRTVAVRKYRRPPGPRNLPRTTPAGDDLKKISDPRPDPGTLTAQTRFVLDALRTLDDECRLVMAFHLDGFSHIDIARHLEIDDDQRVRNLMKKARRHLALFLARSREQEGGTAR